MKSGRRIAAFLGVALAAFWFTVANSRELVSVDLFLLRVRASLPLVVFGSMLVGMLAVFVVGLRADLRTRRMLERYRGVFQGEAPARAESFTLSEEEGPSAERTRLESTEPS